MDNVADRIANGFLKAFDTATQAVKDFVGYFEPSFTLIKDTVTKMAPILSDALHPLGEELMGIWKDTLKPLLGYITSDFIPGLVNPLVSTVVPIFSDVLLGAIKVAATAFGWFAQFVQMAWNNVLKPVFELVKSIGIGVFSAISSAWDNYGQSILEGVQQFVDGLFELFNSI